MRMSAKGVFRGLLVAYLLFGLGGVLVSFFPGNISADLRTVMEWSGHGAWLDLYSQPLRDLPVSLWGLVILQLALLIVSFGSYIGLFFFWRPARLGYVVTSLLWAATTSISGLSVRLPLEGFFYHIAIICEGAVLALCFTSPIKEYFEAKKGVEGDA